MTTTDATFRSDYPDAPALTWADLAGQDIDTDRITKVEDEECWFYVETTLYGEAVDTHAFGAIQEDSGEWSWAWGTLDETGHLDEWDGDPIDDTESRNADRMLSAVRAWCPKVSA